MIRTAILRVVFLAGAVTFFGAATNICAQSRATGSGDAVALNNRGLELYQKGKIDEAAALFRSSFGSSAEGSFG